MSNMIPNVDMMVPNGGSSGGGGLARLQLTTNTTYYVNGSTGSDVTGDGSSGNPWATIQHAVNYVMYDVTGQGVKVVIQVADGTYPENILLGPHEIFSPNGSFGTVVLSFSSTATPGNLIIAPTVVSSFQEGIISLTNSLWQIKGGFTLTFGSSGNNSAFTVYDHGCLDMGTDQASEDIAIVISDFAPIAFDVEVDSSLTVGGTSSTITFESTVGCFVLCDHAASVDFYPLLSVHFNIDPGFNSGSFPGIFRLDFGGCCNVVMRNTWSGTMPATPSPSKINQGNRLIVENTNIQATSLYKLDNFNSWYNSGVAEIDFIKPFSSSGDFWQVGTETFGGGGGSTGGIFFYDSTADIEPLAIGVYPSQSVIQTYSGGVFSWNAHAKYADGSASDTGLSRISPGVVAVGNSTLGDSSGTIELTNVISASGSTGTNLYLKAGHSTSGYGGNLYQYAGYGTTRGGRVKINAGNSQTTGAHAGYLRLNGGFNSNNLGPGGGVYLQAGGASNGYKGGSVSIRTGNGYSGNSASGDFAFSSGYASGTGNAGYIKFTGGAGGNSGGTGSNISLIAGVGGTGGAGGYMTLNAGNGSGGNGGACTLRSGGATSGNAAGGNLYISSGGGFGSGNGGDIILTVGNGGTGGGVVGKLRINHIVSSPGTQTGTLTNSPAAGNPGFWIPVTINNTNYFIPAWT